MSKSKKKKFRIPLWGKVLIGLVLGIAAGLIVPQYAVHLKPVGTIFINLLKMLIVPLVFSSLMVGITSVKDLKKMGRLGSKVFIFYLLTTAFSVVLGMVLCGILAPGSGMKEVLSGGPVLHKSVPSQSVADIIVGLIPLNPVQSMADGNVLQIIVFAIFLGISCNLVGEKARLVGDFCEHLCNAMIKLTTLIMELAPYGVFALIGWTVSKFGGESLEGLAILVGMTYLGFLLQMIFVFGGVLFFFSRLNPLKFFKGAFDAIIFAFSSSSSSATLPVSMRCASENLGVPKALVTFSLPLGSTINMDGTAMYQGVCAIFVAQAWGIDLAFGQYLTIVLTCCLGAIGTAGIPGAGLIMLTLVLSSVGLPLEAIGIIAGVDRILDMGRTSVNVCGDLVAAVVVAQNEKELDISAYNSSIERA